MTKEELKTNKYGCRPSQDVCLVHDCPLVTYGICEDSPELTEFIKEIKDQSYQAGQEAERERLVNEFTKLKEKSETVRDQLYLDGVITVITDGDTEKYIKA